MRISFTEEQARAAIAAATNWTDALRRLRMCASGGNPRTLKKYAALWGIPTDHFDPAISRRHAMLGRARPIEEYLVDGRPVNRGHLKRRLYAERLKQRRCEICGQGEMWRGARMALILDHVNGRADDNRLENLRIVCPNCAATLDTHCGKNFARKPVERPCAQCGEPYRPKHARQKYCCHACSGQRPRAVSGRPAQRKVERPPYEQLMREIEETSYLAVGRRYGVSDNAVRKWVRWYRRELGLADAA